MGHLNSTLCSVINGVTAILYFIIGTFIVLPLLLTFGLITIPAIIYRWIVTRILAKSFLCPLGIQSIGTLGFGSIYAAEYLSSVSQRPSRPSRNVMAQQMYINGIIPFDKWVDMVRTRWLEARTNSSKPATLKYPKLQQYMTSWMGYPFWRKDPNFQLSSHLKLHKLLSPQHLDEYCKNLLEDLNNKPFTPGQSPWEIHIVHSCNCNQRPLQTSKKENQLKTFCEGCGKEEMTVVTFRIHHCLADGISMVFAVKSLFGDPHTYEKPAPSQKRQVAKFEKASFPFDGMLAPLRRLTNLCCDLGIIAVFVFWRNNTGTCMHIPDSKKKWLQYSENSQPFPIERMKQIKNHFKISFSALLMSCVATTALNISKVTGKASKEMKNVLMSAVLPLDPDRVDKMVNILTGAAYKLPLDPNMNSVERLLACDEIVRQVNQSLFTQVVFPLMAKLLTFHVASIVKFGFCNRFIGIAINNFSTLDNKLWTVNGKYKVVKAAVAAGPLDGICGVLIGAIGYGGSFQFYSTVEQAVMERREFMLILPRIMKEIEHLYELVEKSTEDHMDKNGTDLKFEHISATNLDDFTAIVNEAKVSGDAKVRHRRS